MNKVIKATSAAKAIYGFVEVSTESWLNYAYALLTIAGADDDVAEAEMNWILDDFAGMLNVPEDFIEKIKSFDYQGANLEDIIKNISFDVQINYKRALLYDAIKMSSADNDYSEDEKIAVRRSAEFLGVPIYLAKTLEGLVNTEKSIEATRRSIFELDDFKVENLKMSIEGLKPTSNFVRNTYGIGVTSDEIQLNYGYALMFIAGADNLISEKEINWYKNEIATLSKVPDHIVEKVINVDYQELDISEIINNFPRNISSSFAKSLLYNSIKMARADDDYPLAEKNAVLQTANLLKIQENIANTMNYLIDAEEKVENMRKTLFEIPEN
ncbi:MAG: hypothetical protein KTR26_01355 [Flammeovirgaceae bacterium]|nr:hypothetical protein [Flammeovirgaceae bacterium]